MKKKNYFILITIILTTFFSYISIFFLSYLSLQKELGNYPYIKNQEEVRFYKKYSNYMHHLREEAVVSKKAKKKNINDYIFDFIFKDNSKQTILFQGDSWFQQIYEYNAGSDYLANRLKDNFQIINSGSVSYSPSLLSLQYSLLRNSFNINPDYLFVYIDQTDIGDENCRYKLLKRFNEKNKLISVPYETFPYYSGLNIDKFIQLSEINLIKNKIAKNQTYINYKIKKSFYKIKKNYEKVFYNKSFAGKCPFNKIKDYLTRNNTEEIGYFKNSLSEYFNKLNKENNIKKIFIITHPHYYQLTSNRYLVNVSDIVDQILINYPNFIHLNFSKKINENEINVNFKDKNIWLDEAHLNKDTFVNVFLKELIDDFYKFK